MKTDFILDEIRKNAELGETKKVIKLSKKLERKTKKETVITPIGIQINISKQLSNLLTQDLPLSMKYKCLSQISKEVNDRLKEIDNSIGKNTVGSGNYETHFSDSLKYLFYQSGFRSGKNNYIEYWNKQLNEMMRSKNLDNSKPFGMADIKCSHNSLKFTIKTGVTTCNICDKVIEPKTPIAPPLGFNHDFHKQALEAEKELNNVCKEINTDCGCDTEYSRLTVHIFKNPEKYVKKKECFNCGKITILETYSK